MKKLLLFFLLTVSASAQFPMVAAWNGGPTFQPTDIAGIKGWHVARDLVDSLGKASGDTLFKWNNRLWPSKSPFQATDAKKPTVADSAGLVSVKFDGVDDALITSVIAGDTLSQPNTMFAVIRIRNSALNQVFIDGNSSGATGPRHAILRALGTTGVVATTASTSLGGPAITSDSTYIITAIYNGASSYAAANNNGATGDVGISEFLPITIGARYGGAVTPSNVNIYEIIYYSGALTEANIAQVKNYLALKYGVAL